MPYKSAKQRAFMHIHHPEIAKRWDKEYGGRVESDQRQKAIDRRLKNAQTQRRGASQK